MVPPSSRGRAEIVPLLLMPCQASSLAGRECGGATRRSEHISSLGFRVKFIRSQGSGATIRPSHLTPLDDRRERQQLEGRLGFADR